VTELRRARLACSCTSEPDPCVAEMHLRTADAPVCLAVRSACNHR
jgi:hypothetical protein